MSQLEYAIAIAVKAHAGQTRRFDGSPYILHPLRVMTAVREHGQDVMAAAVLHDVLEDTDVTAVDLVRAKLHHSIIDAVQAVTREPHESYSAFIRRVKRTSTWGALIKTADVLDNLSDGTCPASLKARYEQALKVLQPDTVLDDFTRDHLNRWLAREYENDCERVQVRSRMLNYLADHPERLSHNGLSWPEVRDRVM